ncbi:MAG: cupredoxin family protein [Proteobacteria bacterium]|nr:cupredoxin family protein [Pseudomonadota bacterium]
MSSIRHPRRTSALGLFLLLLAGGALAHDGGHEPTAFGEPGVAGKAQRTITVTMSDAMRFAPAQFAVDAGQTVRLHVVNQGKLPHEFILGTRAEIDAHSAMMKMHPGMTHADASSVTVPAGKSADLLWKFSVPGQFLYACLVPGHFEAGMHGQVTVAKKAATP